jgi:hypothetical protein
VKVKKTNTTRGSTLLIWDMNPDKVHTFLIPDEALETEDFETFRMAQGLYGNTTGLTEDQEEALDRISNALAKNDSSIDDRFKGTRWEKRFVQYEVDTEKAIEEVPIVNVFFCGFAL